MNELKNNISQNLAFLRQKNRYSQEEVAEKIGVSRQTAAKWESGETVPDIINCEALAKLYKVSLSDLLHMPDGSIGPEGKHIFGTAVIDENGAVVLPEKARELFSLKEGDRLIVLGDEDIDHPGIALMKEDFFTGIIALYEKALSLGEE